MLLIQLKRLLPWYLKVVIKIFLARLPVGYRLWQWLGLFRHGSMDTSKYALQVFETHVKHAGLTYSDLRGKKILEIGPGDSIATALIAYAHGASATLIDSGHWARDELKLYLDLVKIMASNGLHVPDISNAQSTDDILKACNGQYYTSGLVGWSKI